MTMRSLAGDERMPRYQRLAEMLLQEIAAGRLKPGDRLASERDLALAYGVAPGTVRQAITKLVDDGLLERLHGRGTFVRRPNFDRSFFRFFRFRDAADQRAVPEGRILRREVEPAPSHVVRKLSMAEGSLAISMSRLRLIDDMPVLAEEIWLPREPFLPFLDIPVHEVGPLLYPVYDNVCGQLVARAEEALTAEAANPEMARLLRIEEGAPIITIERVARGYDDTPIEWRRSRGRADQFHYRIDIR